jgi:hypothetical protein
MIADLVARLIAAGTPPDVAATVVAEAFAAGVVATASPVDAAAERRRAADRDRKRAVRGNPQTSADNADRVSPSPSPSSSPPITPLVTTPSPSPSHSPFEEKHARAREPAENDWPQDCRGIFWKNYPNRVGKQAAMASLDKVRKRGDVPWPDLLGGLLRYAAKTDDRPWCNPATWLNQGRWADEPAAPMSRGPPVRNGFAALLREAYDERQLFDQPCEKPDDHRPAEPEIFPPGCDPAPRR